MKICFVSPYSPKTVTGIGTFLMGLGKYLKKSGHTPILITKYEEKEIDVENIFESGKNLIELKHRKTKYLASIHLSLQVLAAIFKMRHDIDVLHLQQPCMLNAFSALLGKVLRIPVVTTVHLKVPSPSNTLKKAFESFAVKVTLIYSDIVTFVSEDTKKSFKSFKGVVIKNGVDTEHFSKDIKKRYKIRQKLGLNDEFVLLFASRWTVNKGIYELLQAFSKLLTLTDSKIKLLLIGSGKGSGETDRVLKQIEALGIYRDVLPLGVVDEIDGYYCMADVFLLPSYLEGLPMALLEAMSCGLPPIASSVGGNPELIEHEKNGLLIEPRNTDELVQKIMWCINNKDKLEVIGKNAAETIRKRFSLEKMAEEYIEVYKKAISSL